MSNADTVAKCNVCQVNRVAWTRPRVDFCYRCLPGGPFTPPACRRCGSSRYFTNGLCEGCHPAGPLHLGSCAGCLAWGVYRSYRWLCWNCRWWKTHYVEGDCRFCGRRSRISELRACRLCWEQARMLQTPGRAVDLADANRHGQQLFLANVGGPRPLPHRDLEPARPPRRRSTRLARIADIGAGQQYAPVPWQQLALFKLELDPSTLKARVAEVHDNDLQGYFDEIVRDHAVVHGWSRKQTNDVRRSIRLLQAFQDTPGAMINATDVLRLPSLQNNVSALSTLDVLATSGLLVDDRTSAIERYFTKQFVGLPATMTAQLRIWFDVMSNGSATAPRRRPRDAETAKLHIRALAPIVRIWASQGHDSLAEIERSDIVDALPASGPRRHAVQQGLWSLFRVLKARKVTFLDPTRGVPATGTNRTIPLPMDTDAIRVALNSPDPAAALAVALVSFHALTSRQIRALKVTDIADGRLTIGDRVIPLAGPVLPRLAAWLDYRAATWPTTTNTHLFINRRTAPRLTEVARPFPWKQIGLAPQTLREDRILDEVRATAGDVRHVCELFGLSVEAAMRYTAALDATDAAT